MSTDNITILITVLAAAAVTMALRMLPFAALPWFRENRYLAHLGQHLPIGVALILVVFTFKDSDFSSPPYGLPIVSATALCLCVYLWRGNALLAIVLGLIWHLWLINTGLLETLI